MTYIPNRVVTTNSICQKTETDPIGTRFCCANRVYPIGSWLTYNHHSLSCKFFFTIVKRVCFLLLQFFGNAICQRKAGNKTRKGFSSAQAFTIDTGMSLPPAVHSAKLVSLEFFRCLRIMACNLRKTTKSMRKF